MKQAKLIIALMAFSLAGLLSGCYPDKIDYVDEYDLAGTMYDEDADFSSFTSFHVIDTIMHVTDDDEDDPNLSRQNDEFILNLIRQNMLDKGYTEMANPDSLNRPDLELLVNAMTSDYYTYYSYWNSYWGYYPGWGYWYPGGGYYPGYPGYPGGGLYYSYSTGTLAIEMLDTKAEVGEDNDRPGVVWVGLVDGLLTSGSSQNRLDKQINQVFTQSPYLKK
jgi:hypothetical protein